MNDNIKKYILDIKESVTSIEEFLGNTRILSCIKATKCLNELLNVNLKLFGEPS